MKNQIYLFLILIIGAFWSCKDQNKCQDCVCPSCQTCDCPEGKQEYCLDDVSFNGDVELFLTFIDAEEITRGCTCIPIDNIEEYCSEDFESESLFEEKIMELENADCICKE